MVCTYGKEGACAAAQVEQLVMSSVQKPKSAADFDRMIKDAGKVPVQVKFVLSGCEECDSVAYASEDVASSVDSIDMKFIEADIDLVGEVRYRYEVNEVPSFLVLYEGREI
jgi:hypothetical protein